MSAVADEKKAERRDSDHSSQVAADSDRLDSDRLDSDHDDREKQTDSPAPEPTTTYPEGGLRAWLVVTGSFCALVLVFGMVNSTGAFQLYISAALPDYAPSSIAWIFSVNLFLVFFPGIWVGPWFDAHSPRPLLLLGTAAIVLSMALLGLCTQYWHFFLCYGVLGGLGAALLYSPAYASIGHFFDARRGLATGIATTAGSVGGIFIPLMLRYLVPQVGFAWATRCLALVLLVLALPTNLFITKRLPGSNATMSLLPDLRPLRTPAMALCAAGIFFMEWGLFVPIAYVSAFAAQQTGSEAYGLYVLAALNGGSFFGRVLPGYAADRLGRFNVIMVTIALCAVTTLALWLPAGASPALTMVFAVLFGFASGSNLGLIPVCISQLCRIEEYGQFLTAAYFGASFGTLTSVPIAGALLSACDGGYVGLIVFGGAAYVVALGCYSAVRFMQTGPVLRTFF